MNFLKQNCLLKAFLLFSIVFRTSATETKDVEASFDVNLESSFATSITAMHSSEKEDLPTTSFFLSPEKDLSLLKTQAPYEKLDFFDQVGNKIDHLAHAILHGNLGHIKDGDGVLPPVLSPVCQALFCPTLRATKSVNPGNTLALNGTVLPKNRLLIQPSQVITSLISPTTSDI